MMKLLITDNSLRGYLAQWVCRQHPYHSVAGVDSVGALITLQARLDEWDGPDDLKMECFASWRDIEDWLRKAFGDHEQLTQWNTPKSGHDAPFISSSRYDSLAAEDSFIDIDALTRNIAMSAWREAEKDKEFDDKFEAKHGPLSEHN